MRFPSVIVLLLAACAACNPVNPQVSLVDGAMYTRPGGSLDAGVDGGDAGPKDGGPMDGGKDASDGN